MSLEVHPNLNEARDLERGGAENGEPVDQMSTQLHQTASPAPGQHPAPPSRSTTDKNDTFTAPKLSYSCHKKSHTSKVSCYQALSTRILKRIGTHKQRRLVPPMYREHPPVNTSRDISVYDILAQECMEQLFDDAPDGNFGTIGFLSFTRLHHLNLHYFEAELTREMIGIAEKITNRKQILKIRNLLRDYCEFQETALWRPGKHSLFG